MTFARQDHESGLDTLPRMPSWVTSARSETLEDVAFLSGAALTHLHLVLGRADVPHALLRDRLALRAAEACVAFAGRPERAGELRDAVHLLRPGDLPGPAGAVCQSWQRAAERQVSIGTLHRALPQLDPARIAVWLDAGQGGPVARAMAVLEAVLVDAPREEVAALVLADAALAQALGWDRVVPLLAPGLKRTGVDKTWGSCGAFSVCDGQPTIENCGPCDGYSVSPFGRPPHPSALSHAGIGNVID